MNDLESKDNVMDAGRTTGSRYSEFQAQLIRAEKLIKEGQHEQALRILHELERALVAGVRVFDLLGDAMMHVGDVSQAVRYRTLYEVMSAILCTQGLVTDLEVSTASSSPWPGAGAGIEAEPPGYAAPTTHFTTAMGHELMRQGQYGRALKIFSVLAQKYPDDPSLRDARDAAIRKGKEKQVLGVLERWLHNIEDIKARRPKDG